MLLLLACGGNDPLAEVNALIAEGKVPQAKLKFQELVEKEQDPNLDRQFILFCYEHKQYRDFSRMIQDYKRRFPEDVEIKQLEFEYYAILAKNAERQKDFSGALQYVVNKLLDPDYADMAKWEGRQTDILTKWYNHGKENNDEAEMMRALVTMRNLEFTNLAMDLDKERFESLEKVD